MRWHPVFPIQAALILAAVPGLAVQAPDLTVLATPQVQAFSLPNGLKVVLLEKHDQPLIRLELVTRLDPAEEPAHRKGLAGFLAALMRSGGAGPYSRPDFNRALDDLGISFGFESRRDAYRWTLATDSRSQEPALELLADAVFRPVLEVPLVEAQRQALVQQATSLTLRELGRRSFLWQLGDPATEFPPTLEGLQDVDYKAIQAFRHRVVRPEASTLVLHGDLSLTQAKELVFLHFGLWGPLGQGALPQPAAEPAPGERFLACLDASPDAELWAGRASGLCPAPEAELLALLLEQMPAVAAPGVSREGSLEGGPLLLKVKAAGPGRAGLVAALQTTLEGLRTRGFTATEVDRARLRWKARLAALPLHPRDQVHRYTQGGLDPAFQAKVDAVGVKDLNRVLASMLEPGALRFLLVGGDDRLVQGTEAAGFGPVTLVKPKP